MREGSVLPSGTVTFLFTDIERSTESAAALGDERWADALQAHRQLLRPAFERYAGVEVGTEGDAFFVAFARAGDAVHAAIDGQLALETHAWPGEARLRVRMGVHTGEALVRGGDYVGHDVHKAKRVCDAGHGGQILLSQTTVDLVRSTCDVRDLGPHRLKDLQEPQRLYQVTSDGLQDKFPALRSLEAFSQNLPLQRSAFIGREHEIRQVRELLQKHRLVTLTGIGGCGKTRLALQVGAEELDDFADGVFLVELAPLSDPTLIADTVANAVGIVLSDAFSGTSRPTEGILVEHLARRRCLLILDNCEHLLDGCADLADRILAHCPDVCVLATSRESLDIEGEQSWRVPSLSVPDDVLQAQASEAVSLFKARAQAVDPSFELTPDNISSVVEICRRLDGIPLAVELAASRVTHLSPRQIASRLDDMFNLLTGGKRRVQRQQTLEASLDWSYELLDPSEQALLRRLAVFAGSFVLEAVEEVCADDIVGQRPILDLLGSLVEKSLVITQLLGDDLRYRLLEPVRLYAAEKLRQSGEAERFRTAHRDRYLRWIQSFPTEQSLLSLRAGRMFETELDNIRAAIEWSAAQTRTDLVARIAGGTLALWFGSRTEEGHRWLLSALTDEESLDLDVRIQVRAGLTRTSMMRVDGTTSEHALKAIELSGGKPSGPLIIAMGQHALIVAVAAAATGDVELAAECRRWARDAVELSASVAPGWRAFALAWAGQVELCLVDIDSASRYLEQAARFAESADIALVLPTLAFARHLAGDTEGAIEAARTLLADRDVGDSGWALGHSALSVALAGAGDFAGARAAVHKYLAVADLRAIPLAVNDGLIVCAVVDFLAGDPERAARLLGAAVQVGVRSDMQFIFRGPPTYAMYKRYVPLVREALGPDEARRLRDEGRAMSVDEAVAYALGGSMPEPGPDSARPNLDEAGDGGAGSL